MANNNADIQLLATLDINSSEPDILRAIQILQKRIRNNDKAKIKLETDIDRTTFNTAINKLQKIIKSKDLTIDTRKSIEALLNESNAMIDVVKSARKAANEKIEFANANKKVKQSADDTADAIRRERNAMESLDDIDYIMQNITRSGQQGNSVFQQFGTTLRDAFYAFTAANILQDAIYKVIDAGKESVEVVKELNDAATSLRMATGDSYESVKSLLSSYNEMGQELGAITTDVSESADEWLRQGHSIEDTNTLIKDSMILSKVSNLESAESTEYLTSAMQGYKVAVENVLGIVDKLSAVDLESATEAGGLAEAMSRTAEGANLAGISMDRLLGMIATVGEVTQKSMSSIGESYKTIFSRMRDIKDNKLSVIGEDGEIEDLSNVEIVLDSLGIKLRESNQEFRNFQEVLDEVAGNWDNYSSVQQAAIAKAFSGVRQQENFLVMMENWDKVLEYTDVASKSSGTAEEKFGYYLESLEAKTNSLKASLENLASTTISDELYGSVLDTSKAVVDLTADTGALKGLLAGLGTAGSIYVFQQLAHYLGDATQGFANLNEAMNMTRNGAVGINDMQRLVDLTSGLSQSQTRLLLSTDNLTDTQKVAILMNQGLTQEEATMQIQTWGVATAQNGATTATVTFSGALRGLWATLMANPLVLVTTLVTSGAIAFNLIQQAQEEARQKSQELTQAWREENDTIDETISKYKELKESIDSGTLSTDEITSAKEDLASIEDTLVEKYGTEALNIDLVNGKYEEQLATLKELSKEKARQFVAENGKSIKNDIEYLEDDFYSSVNLAIDKAGATAEDAIGFDLAKILEDYSNLDVDSHLNGSTRTFRLDANGTREETYNQLVGLYNDLKERYGSENKNVNSVLDKITSLINSYYDKDEIDAAKERVKSYAEADILSQNDTRALYDDATKAVEQYNDALSSGKGVEEAKANLETVQGKVDDAFGEDGILGDIHGAEDVFNGLWNNVSSGATQAEEAIKDTTGNSLTDIFSTENTDLGKLSESIDNIQNAYKTLHSAIEEYNSEGAISVDTLQSVIALGDDWLDYLVDEQGNLKLDQQALQDLTASRLNDMRVQAINNVIDNASKVKDEITAKEYLASTNYALAESYEELAEKKLESVKASLMESGLDFGTIDSVMSKASADISKINKLFDDTNISSSSIIGGSSSSEKKWKDYLDRLLSSYETELELGLINFENFTDKSFDLVEKFYREGKISAEEYWDSINQLYEKQLNIYDKVISAVTRRIDKEIDGIEDIIDGLEDQNDTLEKQLDDYDGILSAVEEVYDKEIERLEDEKDLLQDKIDALNDEADAYELVRKKEEALYALEQAQKNRTKKIYVEGQGYIYDQDHKAVRDAQNDLHDIETEEAINKLEKEQEVIDESIDILEEYKQKWLEISDVYEKETNRQLAIALWGEDYESMILQNRISDIETFKNNYIGIQKQVDDNQSLIDSYNEKVKYYQDLKDQWADIADAYEQSTEDQYAAMILGRDWERTILDERSLKLGEFKTAYVTLQETMAQAAMDSANKQAAAAKIASDAVQTLKDATAIKYRIVKIEEDGSTQIESEGYTDYSEANETAQSLSNQYSDAYGHTKPTFRVEAYSKGGVIGTKKTPLDEIAKQAGEDRVIFAKEGERVLTPVQNDMWEKWTKAIPNLENLAKTINFTPNIKMPDYSHLNNMIHQPQSIVQNFNITMPNVTNSTSADRIMRDLQRLPLDAYQYSRRR